ncbi:hypothetical protein TNCV_1597641 [Trichonephila clavipes]|nr:hypothetical protein TNCV_1597641 [Trichonephila clavipes]
MTCTTSGHTRSSHHLCSVIPFSRHRPRRQDSFKTGFTYCRWGAGSPLPLWLPVWVSALPRDQTINIGPMATCTCHITSG